MVKKETLFQLLYMLLAVICLLSDCGKKDKQQRGIDGYIYESQQLFTGWGSCFRFYNGYLYYQYGDNIYRRLFKEGTWGKIESNSGELVYGQEPGYQVVDYVMDEEQGFYCFLAKTKQTASHYLEAVGGELVRIKSDGAVDYRLPLDTEDVAGIKLNDKRNRILAMDGRGYVYLLTGKNIFVVRNGKKVCVLDTAPYLKDVENGTRRILEGADGKVYCCVGGAETKSVYEIAAEETVGMVTCSVKKMEGDGWEQGGTNKGELYSSSFGMLCAGKDGILRQYNPKDDRWNEILRWSDSNAGSNPVELLQISEENLLAFFTMLLFLRMRCFV